MYNIAILGCGKIAHLHAKAIQQIENARLTAVHTRKPYQGENDFSEIYGAKRYTDLELLFQENQIDITIVCTPHPNHREGVVAAARGGSHILVEKPLASSLEDCDEMIRVCTECGVTLAVVSQRRWFPPVQRMKRAIAEGKIGVPAIGTVTMLGWREESYYNADPWRGKWDTEGGGVMVNQAPHQLDILLWMMGSEVESVYGVAANINHPYIEVEDTAVFIVRFRNGSIGNLLVSNSQKPGIYGKVQVHGTSGASVGVQTDGGAMFLPGQSMQEAPVNDLWTVEGEERMLADYIREDEAEFRRVDATVYYMELQLRDFIEELSTGVCSTTLVRAEEGRAVVELFTAVYRSTRDRQPICFPLASEPDGDRREMVETAIGKG